MPAQPGQPGQPHPKDPPKTGGRRAARTAWVIAATDLYLGGQPGTGSLPELAHRAGERLTAEAADRNGWADLVRPAD